VISIFAHLQTLLRVFGNARFVIRYAVFGMLVQH
jgi:hypothetical protein